jgi:hypothetical protein
MSSGKIRDALLGTSDQPPMSIRSVAALGEREGPWRGDSKVPISGYGTLRCGELLDLISGKFDRSIGSGPSLGGDREEVDGPADEGERFSSTWNVNTPCPATTGVVVFDFEAAGSEGSTEFAGFGAIGGGRAA